MLFDIGEKPGNGDYQCIRCNQFEVTLANDKEPLPACQNCGGGKEVKYRQLHK